MTKDLVDLSVNLGKLTLKNPVMPSSGLFGYGIEFKDFFNLNELGAIVVKGTTLYPKAGNFEHRFTEVSGCASLSTIGLQNVGIERFVKEKLPFLRSLEVPIIVNIAGETVDEFIRLTEILSKEEGVSGIEINLACPNVKGGGAKFSEDPDMVYKVVKAVRDSTHLTIISKPSAGKIDISVLAKICEEAGADAICPNYSVMGMVIDIHTRKSKLGKNLLASVGGPWMKPISLGLVWQAAKSVKIPIIGGGGITCAEDSIEFFIAGASAIQVGIFNTIEPKVIIKIIEGIKKYLEEYQVKKLTDLIGTLKLI